MRLEAIERDHPQYASEYKMQLVHRLLLRGLPLDTIAQMLNLSTRMVQEIRKRLFKRMTQEAKYADIYGIAGQTQAFYNEVRSISMRMATDGKGGAAMQLNALRVALSAEADKHRFLQASGFYDHVKYAPQQNDEDDASTQNANALLEMTMSLMKGLNGEEDRKEFSVQPGATEDDLDDMADDIMLLGYLPHSRNASTNTTRPSNEDILDMDFEDDV